MRSIALESLKRVNWKLRTEVTRIQPERNHCLAVQPQELAELQHHIALAAECLRNIPAEYKADQAIGKEISEYIGHLTRLREILPSFHGRLLAEKARLEEAKIQAASAAAWAQASKKTL